MGLRPLGKVLALAERGGSRPMGGQDGAHHRQGIQINSTKGDVNMKARRQPSVAHLVLIIFFYFEDSPIRLLP